jgi:hypothetical protein
MLQIIIFLFSYRFDVFILRINIKKKIISMYFQAKNTFKNNYYNNKKTFSYIRG